MAVLTVFSASHCGAGDIAEQVAQRLGYRCLAEEELLREVSEDFNVGVDELQRSLDGSSSLFDWFSRGRELNIASIKVALSKQAAQDNLVYCGFASHLLSRDISHILRICVVANIESRVKRAIEEEGLSEGEARKKVKKNSEACAQWVHSLCHLEPWDESLYDILIPMDKTPLDEAVHLIVENARKEVLKTTPESTQAMADFVLAAQVTLALAEKGHHVDVTCREGEATIAFNKHVMRLEAHKKELASIANTVPGVKKAQAKIGPRYESPPIYGKVDFELPSKILLVDDEREFVQTLSERLQARDMDSKVAYNGEEALAQIEKDEPEVIILDLKMPGIDGMEVLRKVKRERANVEVIILTGHGSEKDQALAEELGAFAYLEKPVDINVLTKTMKAAYARIHESKEDGSDHGEASD